MVEGKRGGLKKYCTFVFVEKEGENNALGMGREGWNESEWGGKGGGESGGRSDHHNDPT